jgi:UDP-glucose 4-epimerase
VDERQFRCLVTGGAGFIGSTLVDKLKLLGHEVIVIDNYSATSNEQFYHCKNAKYVFLDIADYEKTRPYYNGVDYVFHLAAESRIEQTLQNPQLCMQTNVMGTTNVLRCAKESYVKRVIFSSTSAIYESSYLPQKESSPPGKLENPYSLSKFVGENLCTFYAQYVDTVSLRYFNVYGPREPTKGWYAPVVGLFLRNATNNQKLCVTGDGLQRRDFVHVDDVVEANIRAMLYKDAFNGTVLNVGTGSNISILDLAIMISDEIDFIPERKSELKYTLASTEKLQSYLQWKPKKDLINYLMDKNYGKNRL